MDDEEEEQILLSQKQFLASQDMPAARVKPSSRFKSQRQQAVSGSIREPLPGHRVSLDLDLQEPSVDQSYSSSGGVIKDIVERDISGFTAPTMPRQVRPTRPKKIDWRSKGKGTEIRPESDLRTVESAKHDSTDSKDLMTQIDHENTRKLDLMTEDAINLEKAELTSVLRPGLIAVLKNRRRERENHKKAIETLDFGPEFVSETIKSVPTVRSSSGAMLNQTEVQENARRPLATDMLQETDEEFTSAEEAMREDLAKSHIHSSACTPGPVEGAETEAIHFPSHPPATELDPNSSTFYTDLKSKYFPDLAHDPSTLAWMTPPTEIEDLSEYHESHDSLLPAQLRFDFQGNFVPPRTSRELDADIGLHHHSEAPLAAGYTVPELAHLSRSAYPSQACIAIQTIGRIMYKVGKHFYGESISEKLKSLITKSMIERTLLERARDRHMGVSSYATEALWQANLGREGTILQGQ